MVTSTRSTLSPRINDLAAPPEPMHPVVYLEPVVAVLIIANGVMIGFQTSPQFELWEAQQQTEHCQHSIQCEASTSNNI